MKNNDFRELVDQDLSGLVWDELKRQRVLNAIREEEKPMKKVSTTLILVAVILCLTITALATGIGTIFSKKVDNDKLADEALLTKYGITSEMLSFFSRVNGESEDCTVIHYEGIRPFTYVLGNYVVQIRDGKAEASWSRDGADTSGGFDADAWDAQQLTEMLRISRETHDISEFAQKALLIAVKNGAAVLPESFIEMNADNQILKQQLDAEKAKSAAKLSVSEMEKIAREALSIRYGFTAEQAELLTCEEDLGSYLLFGDRELPCYEFYFIQAYEQNGNQNTETGRYAVKVNVENGMVEDTLYSAFFQYCYELPETDRTGLDEQELIERLNAEKAQSAARLSLPEMEKLAREAIALRYGFDAEQAACLLCLEDNGWYLLYGDDELPCYEFFFSLGYIEDGYQGETGVGVYHVTVNVLDGTIEDILYDSDLAGEG